MWFDELLIELIENKDKEKAVQMSAYMRNKFPFLGIQTPKRKQITKKYLKKLKDTTPDWFFVNTCWAKSEREFQYVAVEYLARLKENLIFEDVDKLKILIETKSWWDTVDGLDRVVGAIASRDNCVNNILLKWSLDDNFWLRRVAIDHQLDRKQKTNTELLEKIIVNNLNQKEFFINKAIGWSLREYSKTNPDWVRNFIEHHKEKMVSLSIKEASKYI